jgi:hypothetical protein
MACGVSVFLLEDSPPSVRIPELSSWIYAGLKPALLFFNQTVCGNFHRDLTLDGVLPSELYSIST